MAVVVQKTQSADVSNRDEFHWDTKRWLRAYPDFEFYDFTIRLEGYRPHVSIQFCESLWPRLALQSRFILHFIVKFEVKVKPSSEIDDNSRWTHETIAGSCLAFLFWLYAYLQLFAKSTNP